MDLNHTNNETPQGGPVKRVPSAEEIARAEAEAVAAMQRGEAPAAPAPDDREAPRQPAPPEFVPYVDDVPEPEPAPADGEDEDEEDYVPGEWEKRVKALSPERWRLWQILGGAAVGLAAIASLFVFGEELSMYGLVVAALLALLLPRYLERSWRVRLTTARYAMAAAMLVGLIIIGVVVGVRTGFVFTKTE